MSIESMAIALHHSKATGATKLVLVGVGNHDGDGGAWPSVKTLSRYAHTDARSTQRQLDKLEALGEIEKVVNGGGNLDTQEHMRTNLYRFLLECPSNCDRSRNHRLCGTCADRRYSTPAFKCDACKAVDNSEGDPLVGEPPPGRGTTPPLVGHPGGGVVGEPDEPKTKPTSKSKSPSLSTSPERGSVCWACGQPHDNQGRYCRPCIINNKDTPLISCMCEGSARRRRQPGEQTYKGYCCND